MSEIDPKVVVQRRVMTLHNCGKCFHRVLKTHCRRWNRSLSQRELYKTRKLECWVPYPPPETPPEQDQLIKFLSKMKHKHPDCPYDRDDERYDKWYYRNVLKPKIEAQRRERGDGYLCEDSGQFFSTSGGLTRHITWSRECGSSRKS